MSNYFNYDIIKSDDIADLFTTAEKKRYGFFRIILTPDQMLYFDKYSNMYLYLWL